LTNSNQPELSGLTRTQVLVTIAISAIVFLALTKLWLYFSSLSLLTARSEPWDYVIGMGLGIGITLMGLLVYWLLAWLSP
jgi:H+/Cl- antiporter ClcA